MAQIVPQTPQNSSCTFSSYRRFLPCNESLRCEQLLLESMQLNKASGIWKCIKPLTLIPILGNQHLSFIHLFIFIRIPEQKLVGPASAFLQCSFKIKGLCGRRRNRHCRHIEDREFSTVWCFRMALQGHNMGERCVVAQKRTAVGRVLTWIQNGSLMTWF